MNYDAKKAFSAGKNPPQNIVKPHQNGTQKRNDKFAFV